MDLTDRLRSHLSAAGDRLDPAGAGIDRVTRRARRRTLRNRVGAAAAALALVAGGAGITRGLTSDDSGDADTEVATSEATPEPAATAVPDSGVIADDQSPPGGAEPSEVAALVATGDGFVALGAPTDAASGLWFTTDGEAWQPFRGPEATTLHDITWADGTHYVVGSGAGGAPVAYRSGDLESWTELSLAIEVPEASPGVSWLVRLDQVAADADGALATGFAQAELDITAVAPVDVAHDDSWFLGSPLDEEVVTVVDPETGEVIWTSALAEFGFSRQEIDGLVRGHGLPVVVQLGDTTGVSVATTGLDGAVIVGLQVGPKGYVATGISVVDGGPRVWNSSDGASWTSSEPPGSMVPAAAALPSGDVWWLVGTVEGSPGSPTAPAAWSSTDTTSWTSTDLSGLVDTDEIFSVVAAAAHDGSVAAVFAARPPSAPPDGDAPPEVVVTDGSYAAAVDVVSGQVTVTGPGGEVVATFADWLLRPDVVAPSGDSGPPPAIGAPEGPELPALPDNLARDDSGGFVLTDDQGRVLASFPAVVAEVDRARSTWEGSQPSGLPDPAARHWLFFLTEVSRTDLGAWQARSLDEVLADGEWVHTVAVGDGTALLAVATPSTVRFVAVTLG